MKKYILEYNFYDEVVDLLGHEIPFEHLSYVNTIIVDLYEEEFFAIREAGYKIFENQILTKDNLCFSPVTQSDTGNPPPFLTYMNLFNVHSASFTGTGVKVALLGTGCTDLHAATVPTLIREDFSGTGANNDPFPHDSRGCTIIGQTVDFYSPYNPAPYGIAKGCQLYSLNCFYGGSAGYIAGLNYCISNSIDIACLTVAGVSGLENAISASISSGIIIVSASGNNLTGSIYPPSNITSSNLIVVNGVIGTTGLVGGSHITDDGHTQVTITNYSNGHYQTQLGGTSQATMMVAGVLAIYKQKYPYLNQEKAIRLLQRKARTMDGYTYNVSSSVKDIMLNYDTGAGFLSPFY